MIAAYLVLVELVKARFYASTDARARRARRASSAGTVTFAGGRALHAPAEARVGSRRTRSEFRGSHRFATRGRSETLEVR